MDEKEKKEYLEKQGLSEAKIEKILERALRACADYAAGKLSLKQVWYRVRGERVAMAVQSCADEELGYLLFELNEDFYTYLGVRDDIIQATIGRIVKRLKQKKGPAN